MRTDQQRHPSTTPSVSSYLFMGNLAMNEPIPLLHFFLKYHALLVAACGDACLLRRVKQLCGARGHGGLHGGIHDRRAGRVQLQRPGRCWALAHDHPAAARVGHRRLPYLHTRTGEKGALVFLTIGWAASVKQASLLPFQRRR